MRQSVCRLHCGFVLSLSSLQDITGQQPSLVYFRDFVIFFFYFLYLFLWVVFAGYFLEILDQNVSVANLSMFEHHKSSGYGAMPFLFCGNVLAKCGVRCQKHLQRGKSTNK